MSQIDEYPIELASIEDAEEILELQKLAYKSEAKIIGDFTIPPLPDRVDRETLLKDP
jgi:hypothetical protein